MSLCSGQVTGDLTAHLAPQASHDPTSPSGHPPPPPSTPDSGPKCKCGGGDIRASVASQAHRSRSGDAPGPAGSAPFFGGRLDSAVVRQGGQSYVGPTRSRTCTRTGSRVDPGGQRQAKLSRTAHRPLRRQWRKEVAAAAASKRRQWPLFRLCGEKGCLAVSLVRLPPPPPPLGGRTFGVCWTCQTAAGRTGACLRGGEA